MELSQGPTGDQRDAMLMWLVDEASRQVLEANQRWSGLYDKLNRTAALATAVLLGALALVVDKEDRMTVSAEALVLLATIPLVISAALGALGNAAGNQRSPGLASDWLAHMNANDAKTAAEHYIEDAATCVSAQDAVSQSLGGRRVLSAVLLGLGVVLLGLAVASTILV